MNFISIEEKGDSIFTNFFLVAEKFLLHKQIEYRNDHCFFRLKKRRLF